MKKAATVTFWNASLLPKQFRKLGILAAQTASGKKAEEILLMDMRKSSYRLSDFILILTANSQVHLKTLRDAIEKKFGEMNLHPVHRDGNKNDSWSVLDYGGLIVHIMRSETRQFYGLEKLWEETNSVSWEDKEKINKKKNPSSKKRSKKC